MTITKERTYKQHVYLLQTGPGHGNASHGGELVATTIMIHRNLAPKPRNILESPCCHVLQNQNLMAVVLSCSAKSSKYGEVELYSFHIREILMGQSRSHPNQLQSKTRNMFVSINSFTKVTQVCTCSTSNLIKMY